MVHMAGSTEHFTILCIELRTAPRKLEDVVDLKPPCQTTPTATPAVPLEDSPTEAIRPTAASTVPPFQAEALTNVKLISRAGREPCNAANPVAITPAETRSILDIAFAL